MAFEPTTIDELAKIAERLRQAVETLATHAPQLHEAAVSEGTGPATRLLLQIHSDTLKTLSVELMQTLVAVSDHLASEHALRGDDILDAPGSDEGI
ncbi:hypothetical protein MPMin1_gp08 [Microbacterium phage Min1]|uniref:Uncharacterized protein n=1 Tax=Microbacterium phage Min1 TaxID=446529 RepID=A6N1W6_9CAUD|nr:hypothetical protein MPMin1_gp08 [Microbacterium phage Min1]ABR10438.1 hypothetical protein [Microbacterium phage Min1]